MCETTIGGLFRVDARESTEIVSGGGVIWGFFPRLTQWPTYRPDHCTRRRQYGPVWKWAGGAGASTGNERRTDMGTPLDSNHCLHELRTIVRICVRDGANGAENNGGVGLWWRQKPNNVQQVPMTAASSVLAPQQLRGKSQESVTNLNYRDILQTPVQIIEFQAVSEVWFLSSAWTEAEHGYASVHPLSPDHPDKRSKQKSKKMSGGGNRWAQYTPISDWQQGVAARTECW